MTSRLDAIPEAVASCSRKDWMSLANASFTGQQSEVSSKKKLAHDWSAIVMVTQQVGLYKASGGRRGRGNEVRSILTKVGEEKVQQFGWRNKLGEDASLMVCGPRGSDVLDTRVHHTPLARRGTTRQIVGILQEISGVLLVFVQGSYSVSESIHRNTLVLI